MNEDVYQLSSFHINKPIFYERVNLRLYYNYARSQYGIWEVCISSSLTHGVDATLYLSLLKVVNKIADNQIKEGDCDCKKLITIIRDCDIVINFPNHLRRPRLPPFFKSLT